MTVSGYHQIKPTKDSGLCGFCQDNLDNGDIVVAHKKGG